MNGVFNSVSIVGSLSLFSGVFADDYGGCSNQRSPFDKQVMFEHDGCEFHELSELWNEDIQ